MLGAPCKPALLAGKVTVNLSDCTVSHASWLKKSMVDSLVERTVFIVSDSTGITAEKFSHAVLAQFEQIQFEAVRLPYIDSIEKADAAARRIDQKTLADALPPDRNREG